MPIYEYACEACGHRFELLQHMGDPAPGRCPACGAQAVRKLVSATSFVLKGSGWYRDHYGLKSGSSKTGGSSKSGGTSSSSSSGSPAKAGTGSAKAAAG